MKNWKRLLFFWVLICNQIFGQKPPIDSTSYANWPYVSDPKINSEGSYIMYKIHNEFNVQKKTIIVSSDKDWRTEIHGSENIQFSDFGSVIYLKKDTIYESLLGSSHTRVLGISNGFDLISFGKKQRLIFRIKESAAVVVRNLRTGAQKTYDNVLEYRISNNERFLVVIRRQPDINKQKNILEFVDLDSGDVQYVWSGKHISNLVTSDENGYLKLAFKGVERDTMRVWIFENGSKYIRVIDSLDANSNELVRFSRDESRLFVKITHSLKFTLKAGAGAVNMNVWSYKDVKLQAQQLSELGTEPKSYLGAYIIGENRIIQLQRENEQLILSNERTADKYQLLLANNGGDHFEGHWNKDSQLKWYIISMVTGKRISVPAEGNISPDQKYYIYYDQKSKSYYSYEIETEIHREITKRIKTNWLSNLNSGNYGNDGGYPVEDAGWLKGDEAVLLHDEYDIYQVDPLGIKEPIELTQGVGKKSQIYFERITDAPLPVRMGERVILASFNRKTKENGYYSVNIGEKKSLRMLSKGNYFDYARLGAGSVPVFPIVTPVRSRDRQKYIVGRMKATLSPNFYYTSDFVEFRAISKLEPEKCVNWYTSELHEWKSFNNVPLQGVLYKPENFDSTKKYPIIFYYYEILSNQLNCYIKPEPSDGRLNIAWYASNGYLVFVPDIHYEVGNPFEHGVYDCIVSAARYLSSRNYIDSTRMGLQGLSWGGIQTNYLVTHTNIFAAACSGSSTSDFISNYNGLAHGNASAQTLFENGQHRVGFTPWDKPSWYIRNSPIMNVDKVTTPLLMFQTTNDPATKLEQAIELYSALRRLNKKVWLLEYSDGVHGVWGKSAMDFDLRMQQFFNYYLMNKCPPKWMTIGRPAYLKGVDDRLDFDSTGAIP